MSAPNMFGVSRKNSSQHAPQQSMLNAKKSGSETATGPVKSSSSASSAASSSPLIAAFAAAAAASASVSSAQPSAISPPPSARAAGKRAGDIRSYLQSNNHAAPAIVVASN